MEDYRINLEIFEGPLDLLLFLIQKNEVDIYHIPIARICDEYLEYLEIMKELNLDVAGEFIRLAATLIFIKSKSLLPSPAPEDIEEEEEAMSDLIQRLERYMVFREAGRSLGERDLLGREFYTRGFQREDGDWGEGIKREGEFDVSLFHLLHALKDILSRFEAKEVIYLKREPVSVREKIDSLLNILTKKGRVSFFTLFKDVRTRLEIIIVFLAILEMVRVGFVRILQKRTWGRIFLSLKKEEITHEEREMLVRSLEERKDGTNGEGEDAGKTDNGN